MLFLISFGDISVDIFGFHVPYNNFFIFVCIAVDCGAELSPKLMEYVTAGLATAETYSSEFVGISGIIAVNLV